MRRALRPLLLLAILLIVGGVGATYYAQRGPRRRELSRQTERSSAPGTAATIMAGLTPILPTSKPSLKCMPRILRK